MATVAVGSPRVQALRRRVRVLHPALLPAPDAGTGSESTLYRGLGLVVTAAWFDEGTGPDLMVAQIDDAVGRVVPGGDPVVFAAVAARLLHVLHAADQGLPRHALSALLAGELVTRTAAILQHPSDRAATAVKRLRWNESTLDAAAAIPHRRRTLARLDQLAEPEPGLARSVQLVRARQALASRSNVAGC